MKFHIKKIEVQNFRSIQTKMTLEIKPGLFSIEGINLDEPSSKNGSGKSSLCTSLIWCLTGNTLTNEVLADEVVNIKAGKDCRVTVYIDSHLGDIKVMRTRKDSEFGNNLFLFINEEDVSCHKIADTQNKINQLMKLPFDLMRSTIIMTSDMKSAFSDLTPQQRIQTLESIRDYSVWDKVRDIANNDIKEYNKNIKENELSISNLEGSLNTYNKTLVDETVELNALQNTFNAQNIQENIAKCTKRNAEISTTIDSLTKTLQELKEQVTVEQSNKNDELLNIQNEASVLILEKTKLEAKKTSLDKDLDTINKWFINDTCPTCHRKLERTEEQINEKNTQKEALIKEITNIDIEIYEKNKLIQDKRVLWSNVHKELLKEIESKKNAQENINTYEKKLNEFQKEYTENEKQILIENNKLMTFSQQVSKKQESINKYTKEIENLTNKKQELININNTLEEKRQLSDYFYKLLGSKGELRPYLLNKDIQYLNACMQKYIHTFFKNTDVELKLNGATIEININSNGIRKSVSSLSGGEKKRLNISIQLALYDLIRSTSQINFNILCLDEVESQLDPLGCQQLIEIIEDKSDEIETVFWITNNNMVSENIDKKIICKKILGVTEIYEA